MLIPCIPSRRPPAAFLEWQRRLAERHYQKDAVEYQTLKELEASCPPTRTPMPNEFLDRVQAFIGTSEVRVMSYLFRHCWRNRASTAMVSYSQFLGGTLNDDGSVLDRGCGLKSVTSLAAALTALEEHGLLTRHHMKYADDSRAPTIYEVHCGIYGSPGAPLQPRFDVRPAGDGAGIPRRNVRFQGKRAWEQIKASVDYACVDCGRREPDITLTRDHIMPTSKGGLNLAANIAPRCRSCNARKGDRITIVDMGLLS